MQSSYTLDEDVDTAEETEAPDQVFSDAPVPVQIIRRTGHAVLVQWTDEFGMLQRAIVPLDAVTERDGMFFCRRPEQGVPYGEDWTVLAPLPAQPEDRANELHKRGVWTVEDLLANARVVISIYGMDAQGLIRAARLAHKEATK